MSKTEMKFRINDVKHSKLVQDKLFLLGYCWGWNDAGYENLGSDYLWAEANGSILYETHDSVFFDADSTPEYVLIDGEFVLKSSIDNKRRSHYDLRIAHAGGADIQFMNRNGEWMDTTNPGWTVDIKYRIKPTERVFPSTSLDDDKLEDLYDTDEHSHINSLNDVANAAIKQYILDTETK